MRLQAFYKVTTSFANGSFSGRLTPHYSCRKGGFATRASRHTLPAPCKRLTSYSSSRGTTTARRYTMLTATAYTDGIAGYGADNADFRGFFRFYL